jgi:uncharacterized protein
VFFVVAAVVVPVLEQGHLLLEGPRSKGRWTLEGVVTYTQPLERRDVLPILGVIVVAFLVLGATSPVDALLVERLHGFFPPWFVIAEIDQFAAYSSDALAVTFALWFVLNGFLLPIVEELYFRGYLLPRRERFGGCAPVISTELFAVYHFWQPWNYPTIILGLLPLTWFAWRRKSVAVGIMVHSSLNTLGASLTFGRIWQPLIRRDSGN